MRASPRPLSPHLQVYRFQVTSVMSIAHRITGIFLVVGVMMIALWIITLALGLEFFGLYQQWLTSAVGRFLLFSWSFSMFYHLFNGIRHLFWDAGWGYGLKHAYVTGWIVITASFVFTGFLWLTPIFMD